MTHVRHALPAVWVPLLLCLGCDTAEPPTMCVEPRAFHLNGFPINGLDPNGLYLNGLYLNGLPAIALRSGSLRDAAFDEALRDPLAQQVLEYAVSCALEPDQSVAVNVDGEEIVFEGSMGLAPEWGDADGVCDETCQGWVSACLIARSNATGRHVLISLRGEHPALGTSDFEEDRFFDAEAIYFGDLFGDDAKASACLPEGAVGIPRVCGDDGEDCPVTVVGACADVCDTAGCRDAEGVVHTETITVFRDSDADACQG